MALGALWASFERAFKRYGLPRVIRVDNGKPFGGGWVLGLTQLSVWWRLLGIEVDFIDPGKPYQNGAHERMHLTLKLEIVLPPKKRTRDARFSLVCLSKESGDSVPVRSHDLGDTFVSGFG